jgi:hypothetical protein
MVAPCVCMQELRSNFQCEERGWLRSFIHYNETLEPIQLSVVFQIISMPKPQDISYMLSYEALPWIKKNVSCIEVASWKKGSFENARNGYNNTLFCIQKFMLTLL